ncbi:hypothetical protein HQ544_04030 [Candidatus Falkowbacteria bacterium]|nr:hypothetical protein [Candidatus Falkowbacteria bacterium]
MFLTVHAAAGILIGQQLQNPILAFLIGLFSHFLIDVVPHGDKELDIWLKHGNIKKRIKNIVLTDIVIATVLSIYFIYKIDVNYAYAMTAAIIGSTLPDVLYILWNPLKILKQSWNPFKLLKKTSKKTSVKITKFHARTIQRFIKKELSIKYALFLQTLIIVILAFLIL